MIKAIDPESKVTVVWEKDPAVDPEASDLEGFASAMAKNPGAWRDMLKFKEGAKPTEFVLGIIPPAELLDIEDGGGLMTRLWRCALHSVREIRNGPWKDIPTIKVNDVEYVSPAWLATVFVGNLRGLAIFLGGTAYAWNQLTEGDVGN